MASSKIAQGPHDPVFLSQTMSKGTLVPYFTYIQLSLISSLIPNTYTRTFRSCSWLYGDSCQVF